MWLGFEDEDSIRARILNILSLSKGIDSVFSPVRINSFETFIGDHSAYF